MSYSKIERVRLKNNANTIKILKLSFKYFPEESRKLLCEVNAGDKEISILLNELAGTDSRDFNSILTDLEELRAKNNKPWMKLFGLAKEGDLIEYKKLQHLAQEYSERINKL